MKSFSNTLRAFRPALLATAALLSLSVADIAAASPEWVDMGPVAGSVQGHVWSKVVDEVGNTQGRAESWTLQQGVPSRVVVTLRTPDPGSVEVRMNFRYPDGDSGYLHLPYPGKEIPGGYRQVIDRIIPGTKPADKTNALFSITVFPTKPSTDQRYQLLVEITPLSGSAQPATSAPSASVEAMAAKMQGVWKRYNNGTWLETLEVGRDAQGWRVRGVEPNGKTNIYRILSQGDGWLEVSRPFGLDYGSRIRLGDQGKLYWEN